MVEILKQMTNNNQYYTQKLSETATIAYFDVNEWDKGLTDEQLKHQGTISNSYYDEIVAKSQNPSYGPGEEWRNLCIACPTKGCVDKDPKIWVHRRDVCRNPTSYMEWSTEARIRCSYCGDPDHIQNWSFKCHRHTEPASYGYTQFTVAITLAFKARKIDENFADMLLDFLRDNPY